MVDLKIKKLITLSLLAVCITFITYSFVANESSFYSVPVDSVLRGYPVPFVISHYRNSHYQFWLHNDYKIIWLLADLGFWLLVLYSISKMFMLARASHKSRIIVCIFLIAAIFLYKDVAGSPYCFAGAPIEFLAKCNDVEQITKSTFVAGIIVDYLFYLSVWFLLFAATYWFSNPKIEKYKYFLLPLFFTIAGFFYERPCGGEFCILAGRGFPLPYYVDTHFNWEVFLINFALVALFYFVALKSALLIKKYNIRM